MHRPLVAELHLVVAKCNFSVVFFLLKKIKILVAAKNYHSHLKQVFLFYVNNNLCLVTLTITMNSTSAKAVGGILLLSTILQ